MPPTRPRKLKFKHLKQGTVKRDESLKLDFLGDYRDHANQRNVHVLIRATYRVNEVPISQTVYSGEAVETQANSTDFKNSEDIEFMPIGPGLHTIRILAWDSSQKPNNGDDIKSKVVTLLVK